MNKLIDEDINGFDEEKFELEQKYAALFGHGVPREMFPLADFADLCADLDRALLQTCPAVI